ncbi:hypothetical protein BBF96_10830 [Anoxybacter fermentans]|uniref:HTH marR-type domain-containing protein n=1 Tax=Anoxybacter fermentans TaxID=1323375 RepID=A0A3S9SZY0_9FIRM|nr:MarR family transcriptional regulator [Anoxybacter fermentans]AZR73837.1 hypothetical protein BBF96_10830 [Anoxybacter fermentans]
MSNELKRTAAEIEDLIRKIARIMNKRLRDSLKESAITPPQFFALVNIYREEGITIGELCDQMFLACSTVSGLIDRLEKVELVERYRDEEDRRVVRLKLTKKGRICTETILEKRREKFEKDLEMIEMERQHELIDNLNLLLQIMTDAESEKIND